MISPFSRTGSNTDLSHLGGGRVLERIVAVSLEWSETGEDAREKIRRGLAEADAGDGAVVLTDMFGGTPSNLALSCMNGGSVEVVAGINLPMLIKLASVRDEESLGDAVLHAQEAGRKYINVASRVLAGK